MFNIQETYTPTEAQRAYDRLESLVADGEISKRQAGASRRHIAARIRVSLKPSYTAQAAKRAKTEIDKLVEKGTIPAMSARAYRAHVTKRTVAA